MIDLMDEFDKVNRAPNPSPKQTQRGPGRPGDPQKAKKEAVKEVERIRAEIKQEERDASIIKQLTETNDTQQDIADAHGVSQQYVSKLQRTNGIVREVKKGRRPSWEQVEKTEKTKYNGDKTERTTTIIIKEALL